MGKVKYLPKSRDSNSILLTPSPVLYMSDVHQQSSKIT